MGGITAFSYYVPPACTPATGHKCPVLYYLHGTGGWYHEGVGDKGERSGELGARPHRGPPVDPRTVSEPWQYADPATWVPKPAIDMIIVSPHGRTLPGGNGAGPDQDTGWFDWNPRYAKGGDTPALRHAAARAELVIVTMSWFRSSTPTSRPAARASGAPSSATRRAGSARTSTASSVPTCSRAWACGRVAHCRSCRSGELVGDSRARHRWVSATRSALPLPCICPASISRLAPDAVLSLLRRLRGRCSDSAIPSPTRRGAAASNPTDLVPNAPRLGRRRHASRPPQALRQRRHPAPVEDFTELPTTYIAQVYETLLFPTEPLHRARVRPLRHRATPSISAPATTR